MPRDLTMPQLSPTMTEGRLAKWLKAVGDPVRAGDVLAEVETDKATMEVEASEDGILHQIIGEIGADLPVGAPIAVLRKKDETVPADYVPTSKAKAPEAPPAAPSAAPAAAPVAAAAPAPVVVQAAMPAAVLPTFNLNGATPAKANGAISGERVKASPLARRLAQAKGVALADVSGTGPHGRVVAADVANAPVGGARKAITRQADALIKLTPMRKVIASRLTQSKQTVPHFYLTMRANLTKALDLRTQLNTHYASSGGKISVNDLIVKACGLALAEFPAANAAWNGDSVVQFGNVDISVAVSIEGGLLTPIVPNADQQSLVTISKMVKELAASARAGTLKPAQFEGGSFSISNLGMYGVESFSAIINPPQAAILAVGAADEHNLLALTLSVDHRVIDGALGAELLGAIKRHLENPIGLVV
jgi:pyruvate dehydrogenase E2 component (dihydrolipoamide acetyltransferase)